jgi:hypothetical protein
MGAVAIHLGKQKEAAEYFQKRRPIQTTPITVSIWLLFPRKPRSQ